MPKPTWRGLSRTGWRTTQRRRCSWLLLQVQRHSGVQHTDSTDAATPDCRLETNRQKNSPPFFSLSFLQTVFNDQVTLNWWACCWREEQTPWWEPCIVTASPLRRRETWTPTAWQQLMDTGGDCTCGGWFQSSTRINVGDRRPSFCFKESAKWWWIIHVSKD